MSHPARMYVFDVDGVITDPADNKVSAEVLMHVANDFKVGSAVTFGAKNVLYICGKPVPRERSAGEWL